MVDEHAAFGGEQLSHLYRERFTEKELRFKDRMWEVFCRYFQRHIPIEHTVVDLGAGTCEFINHIDAADKIAVDLNPDIEHHVRDAKAVVCSSTDMSPIADDTVDTVFTSNFFEHLPNKADLVSTLLECHRIIRPGGQLLVLMPNIRYLPGRYWDYFDHHLALTHHSLQEALVITGFEPVKVIPRLLPYTIKHSRVPRTMLMVRAYMHLPFAWPIFGKQMFVVARNLDTADLEPSAG